MVSQTTCKSVGLAFLISLAAFFVNCRQIVCHGPATFLSGEVQPVAQERQESPSAPLYAEWTISSQSQLIPMAGIVVAAWITRRLAPEAHGHGVPEVMTAAASQSGIIRPSKWQSQTLRFV